jgi:hypothetical protein
MQRGGIGFLMVCMFAFLVIVFKKKFFNIKINMLKKFTPNFHRKYFSSGKFYLIDFKDYKY